MREDLKVSMTKLSVVLISKNQAWNISRLIESVLDAASCVSSKEIILVDSASTDETVVLASRYPINILRLQPGQRLSPAIGRYVGYNQTQGELVLFLDGDMELVPGWLERALNTVANAPRAGAVTGRVIDILPSEKPKSSTPCAQTLINALDPPTDVAYVGGAALYRRSVLEEVNAFNPFLHSEEESELCLRIRHSGYRVLQFDCPIVYHYTTECETGSVPGTFSSALSRRRRKFLLGMGQCLRYHLGDQLFWIYARGRALWSVQAVLWSVVSLATFLWYAIGRDPIWLGLALLVAGLPVAGAAWQKRSVHKGVVCMFYRILMVEGLVRGFLMKPFPPESFRANVEVIQGFRGPRMGQDAQEGAGFAESSHPAAVR